MKKLGVIFKDQEKEEAPNYNFSKEDFVGDQKDMLFVTIQFFEKDFLEESLKMSTRLRPCKEVLGGVKNGDSQECLEDTENIFWGFDDHFL